MFKRKNLFDSDTTHSIYEREQEPHSSTGTALKPNDAYSESYPPRNSELSFREKSPPSFTTRTLEDKYIPEEDHAPSWVEPSSHFTPPNQMIQDGPETTLGKGVIFKGTLSFKRLLRIDGSFEGELLSEGKVVVGPTGVVKSNISMNEAIIEGYVEGNVTIKEKLEIRGEAQVHGNIIAKLLSVDEGATITGHVHVTPHKEEKNNKESEAEKQNA